MPAVSTAEEEGEDGKVLRKILIMQKPFKFSSLPFFLLFQKVGSFEKGREKPRLQILVLNNLYELILFLYFLVETAGITEKKCRTKIS